MVKGWGRGGEGKEGEREEEEDVLTFEEFKQKKLLQQEEPGTERTTAHGGGEAVLSCDWSHD